MNKIINEYQGLISSPQQFLLFCFSSTVCLNDFNHVESVILPLGKSAIINNAEEHVTSQREMTSPRVRGPLQS